MTISSIFQQNSDSVDQAASPTPAVDSYTDTTGARTNHSIPNLSVPNTSKGFRILVTVNVDATADVSETFDLLGTYNGTSWIMSQNSVQNTNGSTGVSFSITNAGQIQYTSTAPAGFVNRVFQWLTQVL